MLIFHWLSFVNIKSTKRLRLNNLEVKHEFAPKKDSRKPQRYEASPKPQHDLPETEIPEPPQVYPLTRLKAIGVEAESRELRKYETSSKRKSPNLSQFSH